MSQEIKDRFKQFVVPTYGRFPITLDHGKAAYVWDTDGKRYLDLGGGIAQRRCGVAEVCTQRHIGHQRFVAHALGFAVTHRPAQPESDTSVDTWPRPHSLLRRECKGKNLRHHVNRRCSSGG